MSTIANLEMAAAWDGEEGERWTEYADRYEATGTRIWTVFVDHRPIHDGDHVVDIGCGTGQSTRAAARLTPSGEVLGVDLSARMLDRARRRSAEEGLTNVRFEQADVQVHPFDAEAFDVAISVFGAMFFGDPVAAFGNIARSLRPGGRLAMLTWREVSRNEWLTALRDALAVGRQLPEPPPSAPGPFGLADPAHVRHVLGSAGYEDVDLVAVDEPVELGTDADDAFSFVRTMGIVKGLTHDLDDAEKARAFDQVHDVLKRHETAEGVLLSSSAWLVTARRP